MATPRGERDLGRYELLLELARGGMAELFLARLHGAGGFEKLVAIKRILPHLAQDRRFTEMFLEEGRIASQLSHPNICQVFELGEVDGQLFLAMEYLEGASWADLVNAGRPAPRLVAGVLAQAAEGLHDAHSLRDMAGNPTPVVHRDVSPQNVFVTVDGICKVLDFGVSKMTGDGPRTRSGVIKGKLPYMAPEQIRGEPLDGRADVFALGVCAWEAFTGESLFHRSADFAIWKAITEDPIPSVTSRWPQCPPQLDGVIRRALGRTPAERQPTAKAFADELRGAAGFASPAEIADALRATCGPRLATRAQQVAHAASSRRDPLSSGARPPVRDTRADDPGETIDLRRQAATAPAMQLRDRSVVVERNPPTIQSVAPPARGSHLRTAVIAGVVAAALTAVIVVFAVKRSSTPQPIDAAIAEETGGLGNIETLRGNLGTLKTNLEKMRDRLHGDTPTTNFGTLVIESDGPTKIYADGKLLGDTPLRVDLAAGTYAIRAVHADGREREFSVDITAGETTTSERVQTW